MNDIAENNRVLVLGLGGAGGRVVQTLSTLPGAEKLLLSVFDTDRNALERLSTLPEECKVLCDEQWLLGMGSGGDVMTVLFQKGKYFVNSVLKNHSGGYLYTGRTEMGR